jgi:hypothetical protein
MAPKKNGAQKINRHHQKRIGMPLLKTMQRAIFKIVLCILSVFPLDAGLFGSVTPVFSQKK